MDKFEVACYHWSNWHPNEWNDRDRGKGWTEWEYLKRAIPRFPGHKQPKKPMWGYLDDSKPEVIAKQIDTAADHGLDAFIFDWSYPGKLVTLENFIACENTNRLRFGLMACGLPQDRTGMEEMMDFVIDRYFSRPNYWKVDGGCYFSIYEIARHINNWGGIDAAAALMDTFREKCAAKGLKLHLVFVEWGLQEVNRNGLDDQEIVKKLKADAVTSYVWAHNTVPAWPCGDYEEWAETAYEEMRKIEQKYPVPYYTHVSMGWDPSPRCPETMTYEEGGPLMYHRLDGTFEIQHEPYFSTIIKNNTPEQFRRALLAAKRHLTDTGAKNKIVTLYAWNEWTEGGYLEPDADYGYGYLEAIRDVFGQKG